MGDYAESPRRNPKTQADETQGVPAKRQRSEPDVVVIVKLADFGLAMSALQTLSTSTGDGAPACLLVTSGGRELPSVGSLLCAYR